GARAHVTGDRFQVQVSRVDARRAREIARVARVVSDPSCRGVVGEIVGELGEGPRRSRIPTLRGYTIAPLGWRQGLIEREAERLALLQPDRRSAEQEL
ncbi:MAG TPA: hypothetical protein VHL80_16575, partial [Polyangia bacterium]|nr:hypothetical protein [Polyangia bacterium]